MGISGSPSPPLRGRGVGGEGVKKKAPHPQPLSPGYRGEGSVWIGLLLQLLFGPGQDVVDEAERLGLVGVEVAVALRLALDDLDGLAGVLGQDLVQPGAV